MVGELFLAGASLRERTLAAKNGRGSAASLVVIEKLGRGLREEPRGNSECQECEKSRLDFM